MAAFDFPSSPSVNQTYTANGVTWKWNGTMWMRITGAGYLEKIEEGNSKVEVDDSGSGNVTVTTDGTERLRITSGGSVAIGVNSPNDKLHVGGVDAFIRVDRSNGHPGIDLRYQGSSTNRAKIDVTPTGDLRFTSGGGTERLRINSAGRVGINQTSPGAMLQIDYDEGSSEVGLRLRAYNAAGSKTWQLSEINGTPGVFTIRNATNAQNILNIDGVNQRVGVNDSTPDATLSVGGSTAFIDVGAAGGNRGKIGYSSNDLYFGTSSSSGEFIFKNNVTSTDNPASSGTERLRIGSGGNLALGGQNTSAYSGHTNLFLGGIANLYAETTAASTGSLSVSNNAYINSSGNWVYRVNGKASNVYQYDGGYGFRTAGTGSAGGTISWTERFSITNAGHVKRPTMAAAAVTLSADSTTLTNFSSWTTIVLNSEGYDNANNFNTSNYRFTAPETGFYNIGCNVQLENGNRSGSGNRWMYLYPLINGSSPGTSIGSNAADFDPADTYYYSWNWSSIMKLSQNDYVEWKYIGNLTSINIRGGDQSVFYFYQVG